MGNETALHPLGLVAIVVLGIATLVVPRRYSVVPLILMACCVSTNQRIVIASIDLSLLRILVLFGWTRLILRGETGSFRWHALDFAVVAQPLLMAAIMTVRSASLSTLIYGLGLSFDAIGMYFLFRQGIRSWRDFDGLVAAVSLVAIPVSVAFLAELATGRNLFAVFGGVPEQTVIRDGRLRCQGPFSHPIMAGVFWTTLLPLITARLWNPRASRALSVSGVVACLLIVVSTASSTPAGGVLVAAAAAAMFPLRKHLRLVRWGIAVTLVALHIVMEAPVWHLISRIDLAGGSTGWHRYYLINEAINHLSEWWLMGTDSTGHWGRLTSDITNQYLYVGVRGGLLCLGVFVFVLVRAYAGVGTLWRAASGRAETALAWALGAALLAQTMMFFAVSYFGQTVLVWYLVLGCIGSLVVAARRRPRSSRAGRPRRRAAAATGRHRREERQGRDQEPRSDRPVALGERLVAEPDGGAGGRDL